MDETLEEFKKQHIDSYRNAIIEIIKNNTNILVDEDIISLLKKPPLDSMDLIKNKFLDLAKKNKIILNTMKLDNILDNYRRSVIKFTYEIKSIRMSPLIKKVNEYVIEKENDIIKINKKDFIDINKKIKKLVKTELKKILDVEIISNLNCIFKDGIADDVKKKFTAEIEKYLLGNYYKQVLENIDIKILVKDTTLINGSKEQAERYLFTLNNSRLFTDISN